MRCVAAALILVAAGPINLRAESRPPLPRPVWSGPDVTLLGAPSRDGRYISFVDSRTGNLALRDVASGVNRSLTQKHGRRKEFAHFSVISRDSRHVAFAWFNDQGFYDLRVVDLDGSNERILYRNEEAGFVQPCAWSPDGKHILTLFFRTDNISQIALVSIDGGPPKTLRSLNWVYPKRMDLSPDGRYIVYDSLTESANSERAIYAISTSGEQETRLTNRPGSHLFPLWTPDGRHVGLCQRAGRRCGYLGASRRTWHGAGLTPTAAKRAWARAADEHSRPR